MSQPTSPDQDPVLTAWQQHIQAIKNPWLLKMFLQQWQRVLKRLAYFYAQLASLPRRNRRALQRALATSLIGAAMLLALSSAPIVHAATITVDPGASGKNNDGKCSLVEAIYNANNDAATYADCVAGSGADTITLPSNATLTYTTAFGSLSVLPTVDSDITIQGNGTTIKRDSSAPNDSIFAVVPGGDLTLNNVTLTGGSGSTMFGGGGVINYQATLTVNDSVITGNAGFVGGGISAIAGTTTLNRTTVNKNYAFVGGGILQVYDSLIVQESTISGNTAVEGGGGVLNVIGETALSRSTVTGNAAPIGGGILNLVNTSSTTNPNKNTITYVYESTVSDNLAYYGAGISNDGHLGGPPPAPPHGTVEGGTATQDSWLKPLIQAYQEHKGLATLQDPKFRVNLDPQKLEHQNLKQSIVSGNFKRQAGSPQARRGSGKPSAQSFAHKSKLNLQHPGSPAVGTYYGIVAVDHSTVSGNIAYEDGGGISNNYAFSRLYVTNSTVSGNTAQGKVVNHGYGGGIDNYGGSVATLNSTITENSAATYGGGIANESSTSSAPYGGPSSLYLSRTLISGNSAGTGGNEVDNFKSTYTTNDYNLFGDNSETNTQAFALFTPGVKDLTSTSDGTNPAALGAILNPILANNGGPMRPAHNAGPMLSANITGPTLTHNLVLGSPALDKAPNAECSAIPIAGIDQRNLGRNVDSNGSPTANDCDIGAVELQTTTAVNVSGLHAAVNAAGKVELRWKTTSESQIAGFNVWRRAGKGEWKQVNRIFKQAKYAGSMMGATYHFTNRNVKSGETYRYKIEVKYLDNHSEWTDVVQVKMP